jgi:hypothetical protein
MSMNDRPPRLSDNRFRPGAEWLEDRTVPSTVTVARIADAAENGTADGLFRFTRTGDTSAELTVHYQVSGTGTGDVSPLGTSITFAAGSATAERSVAAWQDRIYDPDETVIVTLQSGTGYTVGTQHTATVTIADDIDAVETLIHQQTFSLTGSGAASVTLSVRLNAQSVDGLYTWRYVVQNTGSVELSSFRVPVSDMIVGDVTSVLNTAGWTGSTDADSVYWTAGAGQALQPGQSAVFSFRTDPREVGTATVSADVPGGGVAQLPTAPAPRAVVVAGSPRVNITFPAGPNDYKLRLTMNVAGGGTYSSGVMTINTNSPTTARDFVYDFLKDSRWAVGKAGDTGLIIKGKVEFDDKISAVQSMTYRITDVGAASRPPVIEKLGQVELSEAPE